MKYQKALLCITLAGTLIFSGCGSTNNSTGNNTNTSSSVESTVETSTEDTDAKSDENTVTGMISEITDSTITVAAMPGGGQGEAPGNPPSDNNGGAVFLINVGIQLFDCLEYGLLLFYKEQKNAVRSF